MSEVGGQGIKGLESTSTGGENNSGFNVGSGIGLIFRDKTGVLINFKSLIAGSGITINNNPDDIELIASGAGEANTISSLGGGTVQLVATIPKLLVDLRVKSLSVSAPINVSDVADLITLALDPLLNADISPSAGIQLSKLETIFADRLIGREAGNGVPVQIALDNTLEIVPSNVLRRPAITGDISIPLNSNVATYDPLSIVNADVSLTAAILQSKLAPLIIGDLPFGTAFQRIRTNSGATDPEYFTEESAFVFVIGNGVDVITTGIKVHLRVPFDCEVTRWTVLSKDAVSSISVDINRYTSLANFDSGTKASIAGTDLPDLVADKGDESTALTGWTTILNQGDILEAEVDSITTSTRVTVELRVNKRG